MDVPDFTVAGSTLTYGYNYENMGHSAVGDPYVKLNKVKKLSEFIYITDREVFSATGAVIAGASLAKGSSYDTTTVSDVHGGGANVFFVDGHVKWHRKDVNFIPISIIINNFKTVFD